MASGGANLRVSADNALFKKQLKEMTDSLKEVSSSFNLTSAQAKATGSIFSEAGISIDKLKAETVIYNQQLILQENHLAKLAQVEENLKTKQTQLSTAVAKAKDDLQVSETLTGKNSEASKALAEELKKLERQYLANENAIGRNNSTMTQNRTQINNTSASIANANTEINRLQSVNLNKVADGFKKVGSVVTNLAKDMQKLSMLIIGIGAISLKANIDEESAFVGVTKTVKMTKEEMESLKKETVDATAEMPETFEQFAKVEENAGQLGIAKQYIMDFTKVMVMMGDTTDLTSDEASDKIAKLANITGMAQDKFMNLGSTIVALGNNIGAHESDIVDMSLRLASMAKMAGFSEWQIVSLSAGMSALGLPAEEAGTALSKTIGEMSLAVSKGGPELKNFAKVSGMTAKEFQESWKKDPSATLMKFLGGLNNLKKQGGDVIKVLDDMGIKEVRQRDTILRMSGNYDLLNKSMGVGEKGWKDENALQAEATTRYASTASQIAMLNNQFTEMKVSIGEMLLPILQQLMEKAKELIGWWKNLSDENKNQVLWYTKVFLGATLVVSILGPMISLVGTLIGVYANLRMMRVAGFFIDAGIAGKGLIGILGGLCTGVWSLISATVVFLATNPIGWIIDAIALLGVLLYNFCEPFKNWIQSILKYFGLMSDGAKDATDSVTTNVDDTQKKVDDAMAKSGDMGTNAGQDLTQNYATAIDDGSTDVVDSTDKMKDAVQKSLDEHKKKYDNFCDGVKTALQKMYEKEESMQEDSLNKQLKAEEDASKERLSVLEKEYKKRTDLMDSEEKKQESVYQKQINALEAQDKMNDKTKDELEYNNKIKEAKEKIANATSASARKSAQNDLVGVKNDRQQELAKQAIDDQKNVLKQKIEDLKDANEAQKKLEEDKYNTTKETEQTALETFKKDKQTELDETKAKYKVLLDSDNLFAEARTKIMTGNQDELVTLLNSYNPKWQDAGQSLADSLINGLNSGKQSMSDAIDESLGLDKTIAQEEKSLEYYKELKKNKEDKGVIGYDLPGPADGSTIDSSKSAMAEAEKPTLTYQTKEPDIDKTIEEGNKKKTDEDNKKKIEEGNKAGLQNGILTVLNPMGPGLIPQLIKIKEMFDTTKKSSTETSKSVNKDVINMNKTLNTNLSGMEQTTTEKTGNMSTTSNSAFGKMYSDLNTNFTSMDTTSTEKMGSMNTNTETSLAQIVKNFGDSFLGINTNASNGYDTVNTTTTQKMTWMNTYLNTWKLGFIKFFQDMFGIDLPASWNYLWNSQDTLTQKITTFLGNTVLQPFKNIIKDLSNIGQWAWEGFWDGFSQTDAGKYTKSLTDKVVKSFKSKNNGFDVNSPSKKMGTEIGQYILPGLLQPVLENSDSVGNAVRKVLNFSVDGPKMALNNQKTSNKSITDSGQNQDMYAYITTSPVYLDGKKIAEAVTNKVKVTLSREIKNNKLITT